MKFSLKDSLFLGFCAVFILCAKAALRLHLKIPGHAMFFTLFFLLIARGCVRHRLAATFTGLIAGLMAVILGMGKGGPLLIIKFILPALVIDLMAWGIPGLFSSVPLCMLVAGLAGATRFVSTIITDYLVGMDPEILIQHALMKSVFNIGFGMAGGIAIPAVMKKLTAYGAIPAPPEGGAVSGKER